MERGNRRLRQLDFFAGIPLVAMAAAGHHLRRIVPSAQRNLTGSKTVGIVCLGAIGDLLLATGLLDGLRKKLPGALLEIITSRANAAALDLLPAYYRKISFGVYDVFDIIGYVRAAKYDLLFDLGQWPRLSALICALSGAGYTIGFRTSGQHRHFAYDVAVPHQDDRHEYLNFLSLGQSIFPDCNGTPSILKPIGPSTPVPVVLPEGNIIFCHMWPTGIRSDLKRWPNEYWAELSIKLLEAGYAVVFTGGPKDRAETDQFINAYLPLPAQDGRVVSVAGAISLADLAYNMGKAAAVVSVNTGIMHLAALAGAPTVGLNGPTNPLRWGALGEKTVALLPQSGSFAYLNLGFEYPKHIDNAMLNLPVQDVCEALRRLGIQI